MCDRDKWCCLFSQVTSQSRGRWVVFSWIMTWSGEAMSITRYIVDKLMLSACAKLEHDQSTERPSLSRVICSPWVLYCLSMGSFYMVAIRLCVFHWDNTSFWETQSQPICCCRTGRAGLGKTTHVSVITNAMEVIISSGDWQSSGMSPGPSKLWQKRDFKMMVFFP